MRISVGELERFLFPQQRWNELPSNVREKIDEHMRNGESTAAGFHRAAGWFVLTIENNKPSLVWSQNDIELL